MRSLWAANPPVDEVRTILVHLRQEPPPFREGRMSAVTSVLLYSIPLSDAMVDRMMEKFLVSLYYQYSSNVICRIYKNHD